MVGQMRRTSPFARQVTLTRPGGGETYRFTWRRTFHHPVFLRLEHAASRTWATLSELESTSSDALVRQNTAVGFWSPALRKKSNLIGADGVEWILKGVRDGQYRMVSVSSPDKSRNTAFRVLSLGLITATGGKVPMPIY